MIIVIIESVTLIAVNATLVAALADHLHTVSSTNVAAILVTLAVAKVCEASMLTIDRMMANLLDNISSIKLLAFFHQTHGEDSISIAVNGAAEGRGVSKTGAS